MQALPLAAAAPEAADVGGTAAPPDGTPAVPADPTDLAAALGALIAGAAVPTVGVGAVPLDAAAERALREFVRTADESLAELQRQRDALDGRLFQLRSVMLVARRILGEDAEPDDDVRANAPHGRSDAYGSLATPIAEKLIRERGAVTVDEIFAQLPPAVRIVMAAAPSKYTPIFRLRRLFRRHKRFVVDRRTGLVTLAPPPPESARRVERLVMYADGRIQGLEVSDGKGVRSVIARDVAKRLVRDGVVFTVDIGRGEGTLKIVDNGFRVQRDGILVSDFLRVPHVTERKLALQSGAENGGDVVQ